MTTIRTREEVERLTEVWERYQSGDSITDAELAELIDDTREAYEALIYRCEYGVAHKCLIQDLHTLRGFQRARELIKLSKLIKLS